MSDPAGGAPPRVEAPRSRARGVAGVVLRVIVGGAVVSVLLSRADVSKIGRTLADARPGYIAAAAMVLLAGVVVSAGRWQAYLSALEIPLRPRPLLRLYFVGTFFNAFLPTGVGGDAYKVAQMQRGAGGGSYAPAIASVFLDRFAGGVGLAAVGLAGVVGELAAGDPDLRVASVTFALSAAIVLAAVVLVLGGERFIGGNEGADGLGAKIRRGARAMHDAARHPGAALRGYAFGVVFWIFVLVYHVLLVRALPGFAAVSVGGLAGAMVVASLAAMIPITINGLGIREGAYVWALGTLGVDHDSALAFAVLVLAVLLVASAVGGLVYVLAGGRVGSSSFRAAG